MIYNPYEFLGVDKNVTKEQLNASNRAKREKLPRKNFNK